MHVVVVERDRLHHAPRSAQAGPAAHEHELRPDVDKPVDQILREGAIDLRWPQRCALAPVQARVVDVDIEAVLMRGMAAARRSAGRSRRRPAGSGRRCPPWAHPDARPGTHPARRAASAPAGRCRSAATSGSASCCRTGSQVKYPASSAGAARRASGGPRRGGRARGIAPDDRLPPGIAAPAQRLIRSISWVQRLRLLRVRVAGPRPGRRRAPARRSATGSRARTGRGRCKRISA